MVGHKKGKIFFGVCYMKPSNLKGSHFCDAKYAGNVDDREIISGAL